MKNKKIKPIIIILPNNKSPSSKIKLILFNKFKNINKFRFKIYTFKKFPILKKHTYYFLKKYNLKTFKVLKKFKNRIIYEPLDCHWKDTKYRKLVNKVFKIADYVIFNNKSLQDLFNLKNSTIIHHEYDNRFSLNNELSDSIYYIGMKDDLLKKLEPILR